MSKKVVNSMIKVKTSELTAAALDWAVAQAVGEVVVITRMGYTLSLLVRKSVDFGGGFDYWSPSENWAQGGPIIEREVLHTWTDRKDAAWLGHPDEIWVASTASDMSPHLWGPTPLIAAMRCYVASKLGDEVEIPNELLKELNG